MRLTWQWRAVRPGACLYAVGAALVMVLASYKVLYEAAHHLKELTTEVGLILYENHLSRSTPSGLHTGHAALPTLTMTPSLVRWLHIPKAGSSFANGEYL